MNLNAQAQGEVAAARAESKRLSEAGKVLEGLKTALALQDVDLIVHAMVRAQTGVKKFKMFQSITQNPHPCQRAARLTTACATP